MNIRLFDPLLKLRDSGRISARTVQARMRFDPKSLTAGLASSSELKSRFQQRGVTFSHSASNAAVWIERYDEREVKHAIQQLLQTIDPDGTMFRHRKRVVVKVNMAGDFRSARQSLNRLHLLPGETYWTHPICFRMFAELLRDAGASEIVLVEALFDQPTYFHFGYQQVVKKLGLRFVDLNFADPYPNFVEVSSGADPLAQPSYQLNPILVENDLFVSFAKLKNHHIAKISMTIKNLLGILPLRFHRVESHDNNRTSFHKCPDPEDFIARVMLDVLKVRPIDVALIDGIWSVLGSEGPWNSDIFPTAFHTMLGGTNAVEIDSLGTIVIDTPAPNYLKLAENRGLGNANPAKLAIQIR